MPTRETRQRSSATRPAEHPFQVVEVEAHHELTTAEWKHDLEMRQRLISQQFGDGGHLPAEKD